MNHEMDYDRDDQREDVLSDDPLKNFLKMSCETETELMRSYLITAERIHDNEDLKLRLRNFAEGNAKRTRQLIDEISRLM
ncbi:hypothetical protein [Litchfieldia salsa]|uniref:Uncharacterized protein n=1 Tax=Litchfieldia salsa TaxID=930152 RepID=A0A1H0TEP4_9BACI|nr:hypothetical protein [Litchfieldia salsa]SDP52140.1 hypothetical protein SAMN05216565_103449 [Litchfieldia salsa]